MRNQLFIIPRDLFSALSLEEMLATEEAMREAGVYQLPYPSVDIRISGNSITEDEWRKHVSKIRLGQEIVDWGDGFWIDFKNISFDHYKYKKIVLMDKGHDTIHSFRSEVEIPPKEKERDAAARTLIVLLATRNVVKATIRNKSAGLGIGRGVRSYEYVTTLSLPRELEEDEEHKSTGLGLAPHLRRGHPRRQHHGPRNSMIKMVFIPPVIVNADRGWVATRKAYNVSMMEGEK